MPKTEVTISRSDCRIGENVYHLISTAFLALDRSGHWKEANEMQKKIDDEANSPGDVLRIVKEYVVIR